VSEITLYTKDDCPYCHSAKALLDARGLRYTEVDVGADAAQLAEMIARSQRRTVPQIFSGARHVGGFDDLKRELQR